MNANFPCCKIYGYVCSGPVITRSFSDVYKKPRIVKDASIPSVKPRPDAKPYNVNPKHWPLRRLKKEQPPPLTI